MDVTSLNQSMIAAVRSGQDTGMPLLLLNTTGARTGLRRTTPLVYAVDGPGRYVIYGSKRGAPQHPDWYRNLVANPDVTVELGNETFTATASTANGPDRSRLYEAIVAAAPQVASYQEQTDREIPVVVLERIAG